MEIKNNNLGKFDKKAIYLNHGKYGYFLTHNKINYKIPEWVPHEKIDLELASNYIDYKIKWNEKIKSENEGPKEDPLDKESD
jgi:topoisomerase IA-like protein